MKFLLIFLLAATALCGYFWATDAPGSGMYYATVGFAVLGVGVACYNKARTGKWLSDSSAGK